ncbi:tetratricopeptide repeat protein [Oceanithermus sp.]
MRRIFAALITLLGLGSSLAVGLVLPFGGIGGNAISLALAESLGTGSPFVAELTFPETPWPQGWSLLMSDPDSAAGARIAAEATGADWVLVGRVEDGGWIDAYLYLNGKTMPARFAEAELLAQWVAMQTGSKAGPVTVYADLDEPLAALLESAPHFDPTPYLDKLNEKAAALLKEQTLLVNGLFAHGPGTFAKTLPAAVIDYWQHRQEPEKMGNGGIGPVWKAFYPLAEDDKEAANQRALSLMQSDRALDVAGSLLILRATDNPSWKKAAARLTEVAPELAWGWEELSFAAFEDDNAALAQKALRRAIEIEPENSLYWTNLGWAEYLLGNMPPAIYASMRGFELEPNPVAAYNLGLFHALLGDYTDAFDYYLKALRLDEGTEVQMALKDIKNTGKSEMLFWEGYLLSRSGQWQKARQAFENFLKYHPEHRLAENARLELDKLKQVNVHLAISAYQLGPIEVVPPFGVNEEIRPLLSAETNASLPSGKATVRVYDGENVVSQSVTDLTVPPLTTEFNRELEPFEVSKTGTYRLVIEYAGSRTETSISVGPSNLARQLLSLGIIPVDLDGNPILAEDELIKPDGEKKLLDATVVAIRAAAPQAEEIERFNKPLGSGPFKGKSVAQIMSQADAELVRRFYQAVKQNPAMLQDSDVINAFAGWVLTLK